MKIKDIIKKLTTILYNHPEIYDEYLSDLTFDKIGHDIVALRFSTLNRAATNGSSFAITYQNIDNIGE